MTRREAIGAALAACTNPTRRDPGTEPRVGDRVYGKRGEWFEITEVYHEPTLRDFAHVRIAGWSPQKGDFETNVFRDVWEKRWRATLPYILRVELA